MGGGGGGGGYYSHKYVKSAVFVSYYSSDLLL